MVNSMRKCVSVFVWVLEIVVQIMDVHVAIAETPTRSNVEVADNFVDTESTLNPATFLALRVQTLRIAFQLALLDIFSSTKRPRHRSIRFTDFVASIAAAGLLSVWWGWSTVTATTVIRVEMVGFVFGRVPERSVNVYEHDQVASTHRSSAFVSMTWLPS